MNLVYQLLIYRCRQLVFSSDATKRLVLLDTVTLVFQRWCPVDLPASMVCCAAKPKPSPLDTVALVFQRWCPVDLLASMVCCSAKPQPSPLDMVTQTSTFWYSTGAYSPSMSAVIYVCGAANKRNWDQPIFAVVI